MTKTKRDLIFAMQETLDACELPTQEVAVVLLVALAKEIQKSAPRGSGALKHNAELMASQLVQAVMRED